MPAIPHGIEYSIAVLCYRCGDGIVPFVTKLHHLMSLALSNWEIVLIAHSRPGLDDQTSRAARELAAGLPHVRCLFEPKQGGMGWDARKGLEACRGEYIGFIDGDGQFPAEAVLACFAEIKSGGWDLVKTYRIARGDGLYREWISASYNWLFRLLFPQYRGHFDANSKPKIMRREVYAQLNLQSDDWFLDAEILLTCLRLGFRIHELPVSFESLKLRKSLITAGTIFEFLKNMLGRRFGGPREPAPARRGSRRALGDGKE